MFTKIVLCASNNKLTAGLWRLGKLQSYQVFQNDEQGFSGFRLFLQKNKEISIHLLVDAIEEDFRLETLPHTSGNARRELVERKLNQMYRGSVYRAAHYINREPDRRKDDRFLFVSLNNPQFMHGWLDCIEQRQALLAGVYLLPMISQSIVRRMKLLAPHILLTERLSSGLRQTYLHNGRLRMSRLIPIPADAETRLGFFYVSETEKTRLYLISQRFITNDTALNVVLPLDENSQRISQVIEQDQGMECNSVDMLQFAHGLRLEPSLIQTNPELLHMHLLAIGNLPDNLAPLSHIRNERLRYIRTLINATTAVIVLAGLLVAGADFEQMLGEEALVKQAVLDTQMQEHLYNEVAKDFPSTPIVSNDLKTAVELDQAIVNDAKPPSRLMQVLSQALDKSPEIQLNRLRWLLTNDPNQKDEDKTQSAALPAGANNQSNAAVDTTVLHEVGFINGEIKGFNGDYRAALASVNHLAELLKADKDIESVVILQQPVNGSSYANLEGSTTDERTTQQLAALFKIKVTLKREASPA